MAGVCYGGPLCSGSKPHRDLIVCLNRGLCLGGESFLEAVVTQNCSKQEVHGSDVQGPTWRQGLAYLLLSTPLLSL